MSRAAALMLLGAVALGAEPEVAPFPPDTHRAPGVSFVQVEWALPASSRSGCPMLVRDDGELWLLCDGRLLFSTSRPHFEVADRPVDAAVWFGPSSWLTLSGNELGTLPLLNGAPPLMGHTRSLGKLPLPSPKLAAGEGAAYAFGRAGDRDQVLWLERDARQLRPHVLGTIDGHIAAVAGNGATTLVAIGRRIVAVFGTGAQEEVRILQQHPSEELTGLAYSSNLGVFYATATSVGFAGLGGIIELLRTPGARIAASKDALYVQLNGDRGVLKLTGLELLSGFDLDRVHGGGAP